MTTPASIVFLTIYDRDRPACAGPNSLMGGMILSVLVHPWFYLLIAFNLWQGRILAVPDTVFGQWLLGIGIFNLIVGYVSAIALGTVAAARRGRLGLAAHALLMPAYWLAISYAAYRALWQLVWAPYYWEKTEHACRRAGLPSKQADGGEPALSTEKVEPSRGLFHRGVGRVPATQ